MFSQVFDHISFEGQCLGFVSFTPRKMCTTKSAKFWLDENNEAFQEHVEYTIGPLAFFLNFLLVGFQLPTLPIIEILIACRYENVSSQYQKRILLTTYIQCITSTEYNHELEQCLHLRVKSRLHQIETWLNFDSV